MAVLAWSGAAPAGPVEGGRSLGVRLEAHSKTALEPLRFKGNERACVILRGDHDPVVDLAIYVYDEKDNLVAKDDAGGDLCAAIWYPPRTAAYKIVLQCKGDVFNKCYLSIK
jgi:hypothetical protein